MYKLRLHLIPIYSLKACHYYYYYYYVCIYKL